MIHVLRNPPSWFVLVLSNRMFTINVKTFNIIQRYESQRKTETICSPEPLGTTSKTCMKSSPRTTVIPPKGFRLLQISCNVRSTASTQFLCCLGTSSQIINLVYLNKSTWKDCLLNAYTEFSWICKGIQNVKLAIRPPINNWNAILDEATYTICPRLLHSVDIVLYKNVFLIPALHSERKMFIVNN